MRNVSIRGAVFICFGSLLAIELEAGEPPLPSLNIPCKIIDVVDGDTVTIEITIKARVRLLDCWAPEIRTKDRNEKQRGIESRDNLRNIVEGKSGVLNILLGPGNGRIDSVFSFGRILGSIYVDGKSIAEQQVKGGFATKEKPRKENGIDP